MRWFPLVILLFSTFAVAADKPVPTKDAAANCKVPPGFQVTLFAGEPDIVQPIAFTFDDRGRMWVVECLSYPKWSQDGKGGKDRVVILEDTDGDGKTDKRTVVLDGGVNLSGIELGFGGMYLCSSPNLIFIPLKGDKPGKPEILLDGWNIKDAKHNVFNSLVWGPDGWLYGCNGIQTKSRVGRPGTADKDRIPFDCGVWKFHPTRKVFEVVATGTTNPWGLDFDEHGEMFITNCVIDHLWHLVPGGRYTRMYGQDYNPYTYGYMGSAVDYKHWGGGHWTDARADKGTGAIKKEHDDAGGGHAHSGCAIYLGDNFPKEYRNTLFTANIHGNRLNNDGLERTKSGMKGVRRPDFFFANDPWFRGLAVKQGPAGELYVSDWCDTGECHNYDVADTTNGRIFRIAYGDLKPFKGDVSKMTDDELVKAVTSTNEWLSRKARRVLQERVESGSKNLDSICDAIYSVVFSKATRHDKVRALWTIGALDCLTELSNGIRNKSDQPQYSWLKDETLRNWAIRLIVSRGEMGGAYRYQAKMDCFQLLGRKPSETEVQVAASAMRGIPKDIESIYEKDRVGNEIDRVFANSLSIKLANTNTQLMLWYAVDEVGFDLPRMVRVGFTYPLLYNHLTRKRLATEPDPNKELDTILELFPTIPNDECRVAVLRGIAENLRESRVLKPSDMWRAVYGKYLDSRDIALRSQFDEVGLLFGDATVISQLRDRLANAKLDAAERIRAMQLLASRKVDGLSGQLRTALDDAQLRSVAIRALANYADDKTPAAILNLYAKLTPDEKADAIQTLASRATYATALLDAVEQGTVPKGDITAFTARQMASLKDQAVVAKLTQVWGEVKTASGTGKAMIAKYKAILNTDYLAAGDPSNGRVLFTKNCATCHKLFGEGQAVGPELTGSQRGNLDYLLENVCDPNAVVPNEYKMTQFFLLDGRTVSGLVKKETKESVTVRTVNEEVLISVKEIDQRKPTQLSAMPEGLFDAMKPDEVRDVVKYLQSKTQVPLPK